MSMDRALVLRVVPAVGAAAGAASACIRCPCITPENFARTPQVAGHVGIPVFEIVLARSLVLIAMSAAMLARRGPAAEWPWRSERCGGAAGRHRAGAC